MQVYIRTHPSSQAKTRHIMLSSVALAFTYQLHIVHVGVPKHTISKGALDF